MKPDIEKGVDGMSDPLLECCAKLASEERARLAAMQGPTLSIPFTADSM